MSAEFERFKAAHPKAVQAGLGAAAQVYAKEVKEYLKRGYSTGDYATGKAAESVVVSEPFQEGGEWCVRVGSNDRVTLYWEMGFVHVGSGRFDRVEHWQFALDESGPAMQTAFANAYDAAMQAELG